MESFPSRVYGQARRLNHPDPTSPSPLGNIEAVGFGACFESGVLQTVHGALLLFALQLARRPPSIIGQITLFPATSPLPGKDTLRMRLPCMPVWLRTLPSPSHGGKYACIRTGVYVIDSYELLRCHDCGILRAAMRRDQLSWSGFGVRTRGRS